MPANGPFFSELKQRQKRRDCTRLFWLTLFLLAAFVISLCAGDVWFWPTQWFSDAAELFIWQIRLPRTLAVMTVGAALALAGAAMQTIFDNPLAEPGLLGVANGAGLALTLAVLLGRDSGLGTRALRCGRRFSHHRCTVVVCP